MTLILNTRDGRDGIDASTFDANSGQVFSNELLNLSKNIYFD
jgi:hypothetical protein